MQLIRPKVAGRDLVYVLLSAVVVGVYVLAADGRFPLDDSWIHQVYARNLADFGEWALFPESRAGRLPRRCTRFCCQLDTR